MLDGKPDGYSASYWFRTWAESLPLLKTAKMDGRMLKQVVLTFVVG
jgi:hypothetical protein